MWARTAECRRRRCRSSRHWGTARSPGRPSLQASRPAAPARARARECGQIRPPAATIASASSAMPVVGKSRYGSAWISDQTFHKARRKRPDAGRKSLPLADEDDHGNAGGEADDHAFGMKRITPPSYAAPSRAASRPPSASRPAGRRSVLCGNSGSTTMKAPVSPIPERGSRPARGRETSDDRRETLLRLRAGSDRKRHPQRQRHDADDDAGNDVVPDLPRRKRPARCLRAGRSSRAGKASAICRL